MNGNANGREGNGEKQKTNHDADQLLVGEARLKLSARLLVVQKSAVGAKAAVALDKEFARLAARDRRRRRRRSLRGCGGQRGYRRHE